MARRAHAAGVKGRTIEVREYARIRKMGNEGTFGYIDDPDLENNNKGAISTDCNLVMNTNMQCKSNG